MNLILCDDEQIYLDALHRKITEWANHYDRATGIMIHTFTSSEDLLDSWHHGMKMDALFLDIQIPGELDGLSLAKEIHETNEFLPVVLVTNFGEYAAEGYKVNAIRYLHKPVTYRAVSECMDILWKRWSLQNKDCIVIDMPSQLLRLPVEKIIYIEVLGHYCYIHTTDNHQMYKVKQSLDILRKKLPVHLFVLCHRSYIVNILYIRNIINSSVTMVDGTKLQVSRNYQSQLTRQFRDYFLGEIM